VHIGGDGSGDSSLLALGAQKPWRCEPCCGPNLWRFSDAGRNSLKMQLAFLFSSSFANPSYHAVSDIRPLCVAPDIYCQSFVPFPPDQAANTSQVCVLCRRPRGLTLTLFVLRGWAFILPEISDTLATFPGSGGRLDLYSKVDFQYCNAGRDLSWPFAAFLIVTSGSGFGANVSAIYCVTWRHQIRQEEIDRKNDFVLWMKE